eukprot:c21050_g1_i1 orf=158-820(+)
MVAMMIQAMACNTSCYLAPTRLLRSSPAFSLPLLKLGTVGFVKARRLACPSVKAVSAPEDCNEEECAPTKEVGKISKEWVAEDNTRVSGTYPPLSRQQMRRWTGYVEKDTAGQTNIYSVEPTMYVAENEIGSDISTDDANQNTLAISFGLGSIIIAGATSVLVLVGNNSPEQQSQDFLYTGPSLSYYIQKFNVSVEVKPVVTAAPDLATPDVNVVVMAPP